MPAFSVSKSIVIDAPRQTVYDSVRNFREWEKWSPWLIADPGAKVDYAEDGKAYQWEGDVTGAGHMKIAKEKSPDWIRYRLNFLKPWKSLAEVQMEFQEREGGKTEVVWSMKSALPLFLFWMKKTMVAYIGMDYDRGLKMLKDLIETGSVSSKLSFGEQPFGACHYLGVTSECSTADIGSAMTADFEKLHTMFREKGMEPAGAPLAIYHKWDAVKGRASYTLCFPVSGEKEAPEGFVAGEIPAMKTYAVTHTGAYRHLGNAWAAGVMCGRARKYCQKKGHHPFEQYVSNPEDTAEAETVTIVHFPMQSES